MSDIYSSLYSSPSVATIFMLLGVLLVLDALLPRKKRRRKSRRHTYSSYHADRFETVYHQWKPKSHNEKVAKKRSWFDWFKGILKRDKTLNTSKDLTDDEEIAPHISSFEDSKNLHEVSENSGDRILSQKVARQNPQFQQPKESSSISRGQIYQQSFEQYNHAPYDLQWDNRFDSLGQEGEEAIEQTLRINYGSYPILRNLYVPVHSKIRRSAYSEIDLVMIHPKGIIVFESKNYGGWIFGSFHDQTWTQSLPNGKRYYFDNPIKQNETHIKALSQYLNLPPDCFCSCIVFSERCSLKKKPENTSSVIIAQYADMLKRLHDMFLMLPSRFGKADIQRIQNQLLHLTGVDQRVKVEHIHSILNARSATICPFCGGELVRRKGPYSEFWGCCNYPRCHFTRKIEE